MHNHPFSVHLPEEVTFQTRYAGGFPAGRLHVQAAADENPGPRALTTCGVVMHTALQLRGDAYGFA